MLTVLGILGWSAHIGLSNFLLASGSASPRTNCRQLDEAAVTSPIRSRRASTALTIYIRQLSKRYKPHIAGLDFYSHFMHWSYLRTSILPF